MLRNLLSSTRGKLLKTSPVNQTLIKNTEFKFDWQFLVRNFDLRMFFIQNSWNLGKKIHFASRLEQLHYDLNWLHLRSFNFKYATFAIAVYLYINFYVEQYDTNVDWRNKWDLKYNCQMYTELDNGGVEGEE